MRKGLGKNEILEDKINNFCILSHVDHGKTTLSDYFLSFGKKIPKSMVGKIRALDYLDIEQRRGITVENSIMNMIVDGDGERDELLNLIDTPGHLDFSGNITDTLFLVDNAIIIIDIIEGFMPQTQFVLSQAIKNNLKLIIFINKLDRMFTGLSENIEDVEYKIKEITDKVEWLCKFDNYEGAIPTVKNGLVIIGSAKDNWAINVSLAEKKYGLKHVMENYKAGQPNENISIYGNMYELFLSKFRKASERKLKIFADEKNEDLKILTVGRKYIDEDGEIYSIAKVENGDLSYGEDLFILSTKNKINVLDMKLIEGKKLSSVERVGKGNIICIKVDAMLSVGETLMSEIIDVEEIKMPVEHEPTISISIEPKDYDQFENLIKLLEIQMILDSKFKYFQSKETGQLVLMGLGRLHLEVKLEEIKKEGIDISYSEIEEIIYYKPFKDAIILDEKTNMKLIYDENQVSDKNIYSDERENFLLICDDNKFLNKDGVKNAFYNFLNYENPMREKLREVKLKIEYVGDEEFNYEDSIVLIIKLLRNLYGIANFEKVRPTHYVEIIVDKNKIGGVVNIIKKENGLIRKILDDKEMGKIECIVPVNNNDLIDMIRKETGGLVVWNIIRMEYIKTNI
ncbi:MAG: GTP-binding protein [Candidatus Kariarchaeum pelagius]